MITMDLKREIKIDKSIQDIPIDILVEILRGLPITTILDCKRVCKAWYDVLCDSEFAFAYRENPAFTSVILSTGGDKFQFLELKADYDYSFKPNSPITFPNPAPEFEGVVRLVGSCNGLVCFSRLDCHDDKYSVYVSNPLLGEYALLPEVKGRFLDEAYGFGVCPNTGFHKVLGVLRSKREPEKVEAQVCTIGVDDGWRVLRDNRVPFPQGGKMWVRTGKFYEVPVNGGIHWIVEDMGRPDFIYSFHIGEERILPVPPPPGLGERNHQTSLGVLHGCLCVSHYHPDATTHIWSMKEYGVVDSWAKEMVLRLPLTVCLGPVYPSVIWKNEEILMYGAFGNVISYNPEENTCIKLMVNIRCSWKFCLVPYVPTFMPLEDVVKAGQTKVLKPKYLLLGVCRHQFIT